ncbi:TolC family outer membrane protein [Comamonas composti]|uniref:TolC family outer membrane protein n=1 Tax=Comamonas composti TaxID=408558 RepID=UPI0004141859|nr:TolC family outer membrane protein [Comamonas composti]
MIGASSLAAAAIAQTSETQQTPTSASTAPGSNLLQVVEKAVGSHPEIQARFHDFTSSLEGQNIARGGWRPQVTAQGWIGQEWRSNVPGASSYDWTRPGWNLSLRQMLYDGFATSNSVKQSGFDKLAKYYDLVAATDSLAHDVAGAYLDVQRYRETERLARENFVMHENTLKLLRERSQSGVGRGVDLEQASGRLSLAQTNVMTESNNLNAVTQRYRRLAGSPPAATLDPVPDIGGKLPSPGTVQNFNESVRQNASILAKQALVQAAQAGKEVAQAAHKPRLDLVVSTGRDRSYPDAQLRDIQNTSAQLLLTYNLFRGGADEARVRQTLAQADAARDVRDYTCRNVQQELSIAWGNILRLRGQMPFLREHVQSTAKVRQAYQQQFQIGQRTLLDLLNTENELFDARRALVHAQYDLKKSEYQWLMQSGQVLTALGIAQPHAGDLPEEQSSLVMPEDALRDCQSAYVPDTSNLSPVLKAEAK